MIPCMGLHSPNVIISAIMSSSYRPLERGSTAELKAREVKGTNVSNSMLVSLW
jgi:hypothetical protein